MSTSTCRSLMLLGLLLIGGAAGAADYAPDVRDAVNSLTKERLVEYLTVLASDRFAGRLSGSIEGKWAGDYIASKLASFGLQPAGTDGYFQPYELGERFSKGLQHTTLEESNQVRLFLRPSGAEPVVLVGLGPRLTPLTRSPEGRAEGHLVFAGYGVVTESFDSYHGAKVEGAVVLLVDATPQLEAFGEMPWTRYLKVQAAAAQGARAVIFIPEPDGEETDLPEDEELTWPPPSAEAGATPFPIPVVRLSAEGASQLLSPLQARLRPLTTAICKRGKPRTKAWPVLVDVCVRQEPETYGQGRNVVAVWPGTDPELSKEYIVLSAHYDHIGRGELGRLSGKRGEIFNGADDNASGTSAILGIARSLAEHQVQLRRSLMIVAFDSEEMGLVGSEKFVASPPVPLESIIVDLNMDMISKGHPTRMFVGGRGTSEVLDIILERLARRFRLSLTDRGMDQALARSDQAHFVDKGIPAIFLFGGSHNEYHTPDDDADTTSLRPKKMETIARLMLLVAVELSERDGRP